MRYTRGQFTNEYYQMWQMGLVLPVPPGATLYSVKYRRSYFEEFTRVALHAVSVSDALERACYAVANAGYGRPEDVDLQAVYDSEENILWMDQFFYDIVQKKNEFRGMGRREFLTLFGATSAAALFGLRPSNAFGGTTNTALSGVATGFTGEQIYVTPGSFTWTVPAAVSSVSAVCVGGGGAGDDGIVADGGGGGGGGGALVYANTFAVTPGGSVPIVVGAGGSGGNGFSAAAQSGGYSSITVGAFVLRANGGSGGAPYNVTFSAGGTTAISGTPGGVTASGGAGGNGGAAYNGGGGGGGAGGYNGAGGNGSAATASYGLYSSTAPVGHSAGGGGGAHYVQSAGLNGGGSGGIGQTDITGGGGGGANIYSGTNPTTSGADGNGLNTAGSKGGNGGFPGGGGGGSFDSGFGLASTGGGGAVRIIWGVGRVFPSNAT